MATPVADFIPLVAANGASLTDEFINGLVQGGAWTFSGPQVLTYSLNINDNGNVLPGDEDFPQPGPGGTWAAEPAMANAVAAALAAWSSVADITFQPVTSGTYYFQSTADLAITLTGDDLINYFGAIGLAFFPDPEYADSVLAGEPIDAVWAKPEGDVFLDNYYDAFDYLNPGGTGLTVILHELGHALGLKHPVDDGGNGRPFFTDLGIGSYDSMQYTVMSSGIGAYASSATGFAATPMPLDILAIQQIYGANLSYHAGDDNYVLANDGVLKTIWDAGGADTFDASGLSIAVSIDLNPGAFSIHGPNAGPFGNRTAIAYNVTIENAIGGSGNDTITGNAAANNLSGGVGDDTIGGFAGADTLDGGANNDTLTGGFGIDSLIGGSGDDTHVVSATGTPGLAGIAFVPDAITENAGEGVDTVSSNSSFTLPGELENLTLTGAPFWRAYVGAGNELNNVLTGQGSARHRLFGNGGDDTLVGGAGRDTLDGGPGTDVLEGGDGDDRLVWDAADAAIDGGAGTDTLALAGAGVLLDLTAVADTAIQNVETVDLTGTGDNALALSPADVLAISLSTDTLRIEGDAGDVVSAGAGWSGGGEALGYRTWTQGTATLVIDAEVLQNFVS